MSISPRPDSIIDGVSVYEARFNYGTHARARASRPKPMLFAECLTPDLRLRPDLLRKADCRLLPVLSKTVILAEVLYTPPQAQRKKIVKLKLNPLRANIEGKRVVLVDDSIVRGTTSEKIVTSLREVGAKEVHLRISSPPFRHVCLYGTDIASEDALIANHLTTEQIRDKIGADSPWLYQRAGACRRLRKRKTFGILPVSSVSSAVAADSGKPKRRIESRLYMAEKKAYLILEDGLCLEGYAFGAEKETTGEVVFTTAMTGYLETLTDKSYYGQIITQTFPLIGNYGVIPEDFEGQKISAVGYVVSDLCTAPSNFRCKGKLVRLFARAGRARNLWHRHAQADASFTLAPDDERAHILHP